MSISARHPPFKTTPGEKMLEQYMAKNLDKIKRQCPAKVTIDEKCWEE